MKKILFVCLAGCFLLNISACAEDEVVADTPAKMVSLHQFQCMNQSPTQAQLDEVSLIWDDLYNQYSALCRNKVDDVLLCLSELNCTVLDDQQARNAACDAQYKAVAECEVANGNH